MRRRHLLGKAGWGLGVGWLVGMCATAACSGGDTSVLTGDGLDGPVGELTRVPGDGASEFVSGFGNDGNGNGAPGGAVDDALGAGGSANAPASASASDSAESSGSDGAARAISEADVLQREGDRLYALSRYNGLTIVDISDPARLSVEGVYRAAAEPFEMYVEDGIVFAMFNGWYSYECDAATGGCSWQTTSRMQALDTRNPADIRLLADEQVPGSISDSRRVGDVLYLATVESGYCWGCDSQSNATITSFNVSDPTQFAVVDQLRLPIAENGYGWERSIAVTDERIYVAGYDWGNNGPLPGSVQVVDIRDADGLLVEGARFTIAGPIQSRWQMDEHEGAFRTISQPGGWGSTTPPVLETFRIDSAQSVTPLARLTVALPRPNEVLQSARFDGDRGYAITAERRDPLFTFDLSDPANPRQVGQLEMPGWVYHMEPRGDQIYALGFDPENEGGSLNVSLFDVSQFDQPTLVSRVGFGGDWGNFAEGQNQIHKAFSILDEAGLILVPFSGGSYDEETCEYQYGSGIQLVDFTANSLTRRGVAPQVGNARRAFLHRDHLFGVGDNTVQTFDISNRDAPARVDQIDVARNVSTVRVLGDHLMRFGSDWATNQTILDMTPRERAGEAQPEAEIDLSALFGEDAWSCGGSSYWGGQVFTRGNYAYVPRYTWHWDNNYQTSEQHLTFFIVDLSDRAAPRAVGKLGVEPARDGDYLMGLVQTDDTLLIGRSRGNFVYDQARGEYTQRPTYHYDVVDLASNPSAPRVASRFEVPEAIAGGGWGRFIGGCSMDMGWGFYGYGYGGESVALSDGNLVVSQHSEAVSGRPDQVKYFLDRIDVSNPDSPVMLPAINIPGTAVHYNGATRELVTVDHELTREPGTDWQDCYIRGAWGYQDQEGSCVVTRRSINSLVLEGNRAVRKSQLLLDRSRRTASIAVSDSRIFYTTVDFPERYPDYGSPSVQAPLAMGDVTLESLRLEGGELTRLPSTMLREVPRQNGYWASLFARDDRAFEIYDNSVTVVDTNQLSAPTRLSHELPGWGCQSLEVAGDSAYCAVGQRGVEVIDLGSLR